MRIDDSLLSAVVFIGYPTDNAEKGGIDCIGTAFLLRYEGFQYLVTVRHLAEFVGGDPFLLRVNRASGAQNVSIDNATWHYDVDPTVDAAVLPLDGLINEAEYDVRFIDNEKEVWWANKAWKYGVGIGDFCYTIGLFRVLSGRMRNLPVVHFGTLARRFYEPEVEPIPVRDWRDPTGTKTLFADAYLVESQSLSGLSGAPVFVRASNHHVRDESIKANPDLHPHELGEAAVMWHLHLIGIWQGAWDAPPSEVLGIERGQGIRVPVGMGVVVPIDAVHRILAQDELVTRRAATHKA